MDAVIDDCVLNKDGTATIFLVANGSTGRTKMIVLNPPKNFDACVGVRVWARKGTLMIGEIKWAEAAGYGKIRLVTRGGSQVG